MRADPVEVKICSFFISYDLRRFRNRDGVRYGDTCDYAHDKNAKLRNFWNAR